MSNIDIALVLDSIRPGAAWRRSDSYENLVATWEDAVQTCPIWEEIETAWVDIQRQHQLTALDAEYNPQFDALTLAWATASMEGDTETATARKADKDALKAEYQAKKEAIIGGE